MHGAFPFAKSVWIAKLYLTFKSMLTVFRDREKILSTVPGGKTERGRIALLW